MNSEEGKVSGAEPKQPVRAHPLEWVNPAELAPWVVCGICAAGFGGFPAAWLVAAAVMSAAAIALSVWRGRHMMWSVEDEVLQFNRGVFKRRVLSMRLKRIALIETEDNPLFRRLGCIRLKLYSSTSSRPFFSMIIERGAAIGLTSEIRLVRTRGHSPPQSDKRRISATKSGALAAALSSRVTVISLGGAAICCMVGVGVEELYITAAALWLLAALNAAGEFISNCNLSLSRAPLAYVVRRGKVCSSRLVVFEPDVIGVREVREPVGALVGRASFELMCVGGRNIRCICWHDVEGRSPIPRRILGCKGEISFQVADRVAVGRRYLKLAMASCLIGGAALWRLLLVGQRGAGAAAAAIAAASAAHCLIAVRCRSCFGLEMSGSSVTVCGCGFMRLETVTLRDGGVAFVSFSAIPLVSEHCRATVAPKAGSGAAGSCCLPRERLESAAVRMVARSGGISG